jgi:plastocyanin
MATRIAATQIVAALLGGCLSAGTIGAADIGGSVLIERKLTRPNVTAQAPAYQRGVAVPLGPKPAPKSNDDPLAFERSHVVVYIDGAGLSSGQASGPAPGPTTVEIQQQDRQFSPDMVVVPVGSTVSFPNLDAIFHNIFSLSKPRSFDLGNYPKGETRYRLRLLSSASEHVRHDRGEPHPMVRPGKCGWPFRPAGCASRKVQRGGLA